MSFFHSLLSSSRGGYSDTRARVENQTNSWTGTVRTVGSGKTYSTVTAAYTASSDGDIIEIYGTVKTGSETGGYLLINTVGKGVLIRGGSGDNTVDVLEQDTAASYTVRLRHGGTHIMFKDITIKSNQAADNVWIEYGQGSIKNVVFDNVRIVNTSTTAGRLIAKLSDSAQANVYLECKNTYFECNGTSSAGVFIQAAASDSIHLFTGCEFVNNGGGTTLNFATTSLGSIIGYNNTFSHNGNGTCVNFGLDGSNSANTITLVDFRENEITVGSTFGNHIVLFGSDTDNVYAVSNTISVPSDTTSSGFGFVIKTVATSVGNAEFYDNTITAPRPFYLKGAINITGKYNRVTNNASPAANGAFEFVNVDDAVNGDVLSTGNVITHNTFEGANGILLYDGGASEEEDVTILTNTINNNVYRYTSAYLYNARTATGYSFAERSDFWGENTNDSASSGTQI